MQYTMCIYQLLNGSLGAPLLKDEVKLSYAPSNRPCDSLIHCKNQTVLYIMRNHLDNEQFQLFATKLSQPIINRLKVFWYSYLESLIHFVSHRYIYSTESWRKYCKIHVLYIWNMYLSIFLLMCCNFFFFYFLPFCTAILYLFFFFVLIAITKPF